MPKSVLFPAVLLFLGCAASSLYGQHSLSPALTDTTAQSVSSSTPKLDLRSGEHRFWDRENDLLFTGVAASRTFDYFSTLNMRRRGRQEIFLTNAAVDNHAGFAFIEAGATGVSIGAAYLFHRYGHHKLERWTSIVHIGVASGGAVRNYCLKTAHPAGAAQP
jgi:hypothetical protein